MDKVRLEEQLDIIFTNESNDPRKRHYSYVGKNVLHSLIDKENLLVDNVRDYKLDFPNLQLLMKLHQKIQSNEPMKKAFVESLKLRIHTNGHFYEVGYLAFGTLLKLGFIKEAIRALELRWGRNPLVVSIEELVNYLTRYIMHEYHIFAEGELKYIAGKVHRDSTLGNLLLDGELLAKIPARINQVFYLRLEKEMN